MGSNAENRFLKHAKIEKPLICGAMYPCSNPELVAAASEAGGLGIVQPISLVYAHGYDFRKGLKYIQSLTNKPVGLNLLVEKSAKRYEDRLKMWLDIALEEGVRFFVTALGNPRWVIDRVRPVGGIVYHDVTARKWAEKAVSEGVDGLICVNNRAGGHLGDLDPAALFEELKSFGLPLICAGGIGDSGGFKQALEIGYEGVQLGTRFIASLECSAHIDYKKAIVESRATDIVSTVKISGVPVSVIKTPFIEKNGLEVSAVTAWMLAHPELKRYIRMYYTLRSIFQLKKSNKLGSSYKDYFQAGKSVEGINEILSVKDIVKLIAG